MPAWADVALGAVDEQRRHAELALQRPRRHPHDVTRQREIARPEHRPVDRVIPDERDRRSRRRHDLDDDHLGIGRGRQAPDGHGRRVHRAHAETRGRQSVRGALDGRDDPVDERPPDLEILTVDGQEPQQRGVDECAGPRVRVRGRDHHGRRRAARPEARRDGVGEFAIHRDQIDGDPDQAHSSALQHERSRGERIETPLMRLEPERVRVPVEEVGDREAARESSVARERRSLGKAERR